MEMVRTVRICNQEATMLENSGSTEEKVVASIDRNKETLTGNEGNLTSGDTNADSNRNKFEFESDPTLHEALDNGPEKIIKFRQQCMMYKTRTHMDYWKNGS